MSSEQNKVILRAEHISKTYGEKKVLEDISIYLEQGELVSLLGVSGSGKTTLFNVLSGIIPPDEGKVYLKDQDVTSTPGSISYMLQKDLLLPHKKVIDNVALPLVLKGVKKAEAREKTNPLFAEFGLEGTQYQYPSQLSGGMRQRVCIAIGLACNPRLIIADEPTTALDVTIQAQILDLMRNLKDKINSSIMLITHDLGVIAEMADYVVVMYAGRVVEKGTASEIFKNPSHPYTIGLMRSKPVVGKKVDSFTVFQVRFRTLLICRITAISVIAAKCAARNAMENTPARSACPRRTRSAAIAITIRRRENKCSQSIRISHR